MAYNYSDPDMEDVLDEIASLRQFCRFELDRMLDESAILILRFRHLLEQHNLAQQGFATVNRQLAAQSFSNKMIVDVSLIAAPPSTRNTEGKRNSERYSSKKGGPWRVSRTQAAV
ncbi:MULTISPECIES: transposase [Nitrosomonas]|nr:transposase [Nitrosomonas eutropha]